MNNKIIGLVLIIIGAISMCAFTYLLFYNLLTPFLLIITIFCFCVFTFFGCTIIKCDNKYNIDD